MKAEHVLEMPISAVDDECGKPVECAKRRLPTVAAFVIALASSIVLTLAGCAEHRRHRPPGEADCAVDGRHR